MSLQANDIHEAAPLIEARNLIKDYGSARVVDHVSLQIFRGETLGLVGESGSGKSTVARMLLRLIEPSAGEVLYYANGEAGEGCDLLRLPANEMRALRRKLEIVFQDPYAALNPHIRVK